jgi:hypothetical protein
LKLRYTALTGGSSGGEHPHLPGEALESTISGFEVERAELDSVLNSETFARAGNLAKILRFACDKYFQGATDELKEYDIAVHALGRSESFDPQIDTIVRVSASALRKRLEQYYRTEGADHGIQICLPPGGYVPKFVRKPDAHAEKVQLGSHGAGEAANAAAAPADATPASEFQSARSDKWRSNRAWDPGQARLAPVTFDLPPAASRRFRIGAALAVALFSLCALVVATLFVRHRARNAGLRPEPIASSALLPGDASGNSIHTLVGDNRAPYLDRAGQTWSSDASCSGGISFAVPARVIWGTWDPQLFLGGRSGLFHCAFSVPAGTYEVHLLFAETTVLVESSRTVAYSVNGGAPGHLDVVDDAGGDDIETEKVFVDVRPEGDGKIHLDFPSSSSYVNAIEILPGSSKRMLPLRIHAGQTPYHDPEGNVWLPNRYFFGGRASRLDVVDAASLPDSGLFVSQWIGHFHYSIPVAPGERYTVKLHFRESWFGGQGGAEGGTGSRVFDVWCNGTVILKNFDIFKEAGAAPLTKTFQHIEPTGQDKIELYFAPVVDYPSLNAIEVIAE